MPFRDDLDALAARHAALDTEVADRTRERDAAKQLLDDARARAKLPVLDNIRVASPCRADWAKMTGDDRVRACGECKQNVYNLSELTREEAEALIVEHAGRLCVRYYQRADGTILLADCTIGARRRRRTRVIVAAGLAGALAAGAAVALHRSEPKDEPVMGSITATPVAIEPPSPPPATPHVDPANGPQTVEPIEPSNLAPMMGAVSIMPDHAARSPKR
jgi:hypothetical protein